MATGDSPCWFFTCLKEHSCIGRNLGVRSIFLCRKLLPCAHWRLPPPRLMPFSATKSYSVPASMPSRCLEKPTRQTKMQKPPTSSSRKLNQLYGASASPWSRWFCSHFFFVFPFLFKWGKSFPLQSMFGAHFCLLSVKYKSCFWFFFDFCKLTFYTLFL